MIDIIYYLLLAIGIYLGFFVVYQTLFAIFSLLYKFLKNTEYSNKNHEDIRFGVIIPAHNEELLIGDLVDSILSSNYPKDKIDVMVIADNCDADDKTAQIAREKGATSYERFNTNQRGKPYALDWLISQIDLDKYDSFVIIDADTVIHPEFLHKMADKLHSGAEVIQGYFGVMNPDENWLTRLSILPGVLKFKLHYPGKILTGLSCPLAGNGMCFTADIFKQYGWKAYSIAENWEYYAQLTVNGHLVTSEPEAIIYSQVAKSLKSGKDQRVRWLRGRMDTWMRYWPQLIKKSLTSFSLVGVDALIELVKPSHSLLIFWSIVYMVFCFGFYYLFELDPSIITLASLIVGLQIIYFLMGLVIQKAPLQTWLSLFMVPPYLVWKVFISIKGMIGFDGKEWIKTERHKSENKF